MTTLEKLAAVKLGTSVIYVDAQGVEHNSIAKGPATAGYNQGLKSYGAFVGLTYLDQDTGAPVTLMAVPLLTSEMDDAFLSAAADYMARRDALATRNAAGVFIDTREAHLTRMIGQPREIGWKFPELIYMPQNTASAEDVAAAQKAINVRRPTIAELEEILKEDDVKVIVNPDGSLSTEKAVIVASETPTSNDAPTPSADDLDAAAAEQAAKDATAAMEASDNPTIDEPEPSPEDAATVDALVDHAETKLAPFQPEAEPSESTESATPEPAIEAATQNDAADQSA